MFPLILEGEEGRGNISQLLPVHTQSRDGTWDLSMYRVMHQPTDPPARAEIFYLIHCFVQNMVSLCSIPAGKLQVNIFLSMNQIY